MAKPKIDPKMLAAIVAAVIKAQSQPNKTVAQFKAASMKINKTGDMSVKDQRKLQLELLTKEAFEKAGYEKVIPRVNVLTAGGWAAQGKTVLNGQQPLWVKAPWMSAKQMGYPMFHISQVA